MQDTKEQQKCIFQTTNRSQLKDVSLRKKPLKNNKIKKFSKKTDIKITYSIM